MLKSKTNRLVKFLALFCGSGILLLTLLPLTTTAAFTKQINYQGKLSDGTGASVVDGTYSITFKLYDAPTGGSALWTETQSVVVASGLFSTMLGSVSSLDNINFNQALYLTLNVNGDGEMSPRKVIGAVPAAFQTSRLDGSASTTVVDVSDYLSVSGLTNLATTSLSGDIFINSLTNLSGTDYQNFVQTGYVYTDDWAGDTVASLYSQSDSGVGLTGQGNYGVIGRGSIGIIGEGLDIGVAGITKNDSSIAGEFYTDGNYSTGLKVETGGLGGLGVDIYTGNAEKALNVYNSSSTAYSIYSAGGLNQFEGSTVFGSSPNTLSISQVDFVPGLLSGMELSGITNLGLPFFSIKNGLFLRGADVYPGITFGDSTFTYQSSIAYSTTTRAMNFNNASVYNFDQDLSVSGTVKATCFSNDGGLTCITGGAGVSGGGDSLWATTSLSGRVIHPSVSNVYPVVIGDNATTSDSIFEVNGDTKLRNNLTVGGLSFLSGVTVSSLSIGSLSGLLFGVGGAVGSLATSSLGLITTNVAEGSNLYWTNNRFDSRLMATTSLPNLATLSGLSSLGSSTGQTTILGKTILTNASTTALSVSGQTYLTGLLTGVNANFTGTLGVTGKTTLANASTTALSVSGQTYLTGNLGIGLTNPSTALSVLGVASSTGLQVNGNGFLTGALSVGTSSVASKFNLQGSPGLSVLNISSSTGASIFTIAGNGSIGIGTSTPSSSLSIATKNAGDGLNIDGTSSFSPFVTFSYNSTQAGGLGLALVGNHGVTGANPFDMVLLAKSAGSNLLFGASNTEYMMISGNGNIGMGTNTPVAALDIYNSRNLTDFTSVIDSTTVSVPSSPLLSAGYKINSTGLNSVMLGAYSTSSMAYTFSYGQNNLFTRLGIVGEYDTVFGSNNRFNASMGSLTVGNNNNSHLLGSSYLFGNNNDVSGIGTKQFVLGNGNLISSLFGDNYVFGSDNNMHSAENFVVGNNNNLSQEGSYVFGSNNYNDDGNTSAPSYILGSNSTTTTGYAFVFGNNLSVTATSSFLFGVDNGTYAVNKNYILSVMGARNGIGFGTTTPAYAFVVGSGAKAATSSIQVPRGGICVDDDGWCTPTDGKVSAVNYTTGHSDLAENYPAFERDLGAGDIVSISSLNNSGLAFKADFGVKKAVSGETSLGVISTNPGITLGLDNEINNIGQVPVALSGRVPVKVNLEGGVINVGDRITLSSFAGVGTKATSSAETIGIALGAFNALSPQTNGIGQVLVFVNLGYAHLDTSSVNRPLGTFSDFSGQTLANVQAIISSSGNWSIDSSGNLTAKTLTADKLCLGLTCVTEGELRTILEKAGLLSSPVVTPSPDPTSSDPVIETKDTAPEATSSESISVDPIITPESQ